MSKGNHVSDGRRICRASLCAAAALATTAGLAGAGCGSSGSSGKAAGTSAASVPFPVAVGDTWEYRLAARGGSGTMTKRMTSVMPVTGGRKVMMTETTTIAGTPIRTESVYFVHSDGSITSSTLLPQAEQRNTVTISSDSANWPPAAIIDSGRLVKLDVPTTMKGAERTYRTTAHITIQGEGTATVTVPAGTYRAVVVNRTTTVSFFGIGRPVTSYDKTWLAPGVGVVQEQLALTNTAGSFHRTATIELESFSKD